VNERGTVWTQHDGYPASGTRSTTTWEPGETVQDRHLIPIHDSVPPGEYELAVGMYINDRAALPRLPIVDGNGYTKDNSLVVGRIRVVP